MSVIMGRIISVVGAIVDIDSRVVTAAGEVVKLFEGVAVFVWISCSSFGKDCCNYWKSYGDCFLSFRY